VRLGKALGYAVDAVARKRIATFPEADRVLAQSDAASLRSRPTRRVPGVRGGGHDGPVGRGRVRAAVALEPPTSASWPAARASPRFGTPCSRAAARLTRSRESPIPPENIGAQLPEEIALSVLAEIVQTPRRARAAAARPIEALDPICGMTVVIATARHTAEFGGDLLLLLRRVPERFLREPERFATAATAGVGREG
jgi:hypothetical protein